MRTQTRLRPGVRRAPVRRLDSERRIKHPVQHPEIHVGELQRGYDPELGLAACGAAAREALGGLSASGASASGVRLISSLARGLS